MEHQSPCGQGAGLGRRLQRSRWLRASVRPQVILAEAQDVRGALEGMSDSSPAILDDIKQKLRASLPD